MHNIILNDKQFKLFKDAINAPVGDNPALRELMKDKTCEWCQQPIFNQVVHDIDEGTYFHNICAIKNREIELAWDATQPFLKTHVTSQVLPVD